MITVYLLTYLALTFCLYIRNFTTILQHYSIFLNLGIFGKRSSVLIVLVFVIDFMLPFSDVDVTTADFNLKSSVDGDLTDNEKNWRLTTLTSLDKSETTPIHMYYENYKVLRL